jgi:hypothetical protein
MATTAKKVLIYEQDHQTAGYIEFSARQFDLVPIKAARWEEAQRQIDEGSVDIAFISSGLPGLTVPKHVCVVPILDKAGYNSDLLFAYSAMRVLHKPASIFEVMAILQSILDPDVSQRADYAFHMLRSKMMLRSLKFLLAMSQDDQHGRFNMKESLYQFCVGQCPRAILGELADSKDQEKYRLLTVSLQFGKRQCALRDECKLHRFSDWLQEHHREVLESRPQDLFPKLADGDGLDKVQATIDQLLEKYEAALQHLYELKKDFCAHQCGLAINGTEFKPGDVLISEWADIFRNECIYCTQPDCPLNLFFKLLVYQFKSA